MTHDYKKALEDLARADKPETKEVGARYRAVRDETLLDFVEDNIEAIRAALQSQICPVDESVLKSVSNLLKMFLHQWEVAKREATRCGRIEAVREFNASCAEGGRVHDQITAYFGCKTINEAYELLKKFGHGESLSIEFDKSPPTAISRDEVG